MAFRLLSLGLAGGFGAGALSSFGCSTVHASEAAPADASSTKQDEPGRTKPVKLVVVGGGFAGARTAYQLDSVFHVTLIDQKNYYEATDELAHVINGPDEEVQERIENITALHRFYLRRARVVTNTVVDVKEDAVVLKDGRTIPFDICVVAVGEKRPYPFRPEARTADVREAQIKAYRTLLRRKDMHKIAVIGGGIRGCSFASTLSTSCPDKEVHIFHSTGSLAPTLPYEARNRVEDILAANPCIKVHRNSVVTDVHYTNRPSFTADTKQRVSSWWPFGKKAGVSTTVGQSSQTATQQQAGEGEQPAHSRHAQVLPAANSKGELMAGIDYEVASAASTSPYLEAKFALDVSLREDMRKQVDSVLYQAINGDTHKFTVERGAEIGKETLDGFDLVINCAGSISNARIFESSEALGPHIDPKGHIVISKYCQLYGLPHMFAVGRCANIHWVKSMGASDFQTRMLFRNLLTVASLSDNKAMNWLPTMSPVTRESMSFPRVIVPFDESQAVGSTAWTGSVVGPVALKEMTQDRQHYLREFRKPIFYKQQDDHKVRNSVDGYFANAATDPTDFDLDL